MSERKPSDTTEDPTADGEPGPLPPPPGNRGAQKSGSRTTGDDPPADDPPTDADDASETTAAKPAAKPAAAAKKTPAKKSAPRSKPAEKSAEKSAGTPPAATQRPMTAADYARTVSGDPASTSVFPRVTDDGAVREPATAQQPTVTVPADTEPVTRQARLSLVHIDPWSTTQLAFVVSTALMIVAIVAVTAFWLVLNVTGVWDNLNDTVNSVLSSEDGTFDVADYLGFGRVIGLTIVLSLINVVLMTALAAIGARLYNAATHLVGGVQVTFRDRG